jgi:hypothetical protein
MWLELNWNAIGAGAPVQNGRRRELQGPTAKGMPAVFLDLTDAREKTGRRRRDYNQNRRHKRARRPNPARVSEPTRWRLLGPPSWIGQRRYPVKSSLVPAKNPPALDRAEGLPPKAGSISFRRDARLHESFSYF